MKLIDFKDKVAGILFALALLFGIGISGNSTVQAQYPQQYPQSDRYRRDRDYQDRRYRERGRRTDDGYPDLGGSFNLRQTALNAGYNAGIKEGREDRRRGQGYEFRDESDFQRASKDYNSRLGDLGLYRTYFRQAFSNGYADGYRGY